MSVPDTETNQDDWSAFGATRFTDLVTVAHVTHVHTALEILRARSIKPQLVADKSRLNTERILVVWLSPNDWDPAGGYRYGNVAFHFELPALLEGKKSYWIGTMPYNTPACRILISDRDRPFKPYTPENGDGPWWLDNSNGMHFWNGRFCLEFMLECEIPLDRVREVRFVQHHNEMCSIDRVTCGDRGNESERGAARFLAGACHRRLLSSQPLLWITPQGLPKESLLFAWRALRSRIATDVEAWEGPVRQDSGKAAAFARAAMGAGCDRLEDRVAFVGSFVSREAAVHSCASVIEADLGLTNGALPRD